MDKENKSLLGDVLKVELDAAVGKPEEKLTKELGTTKNEFVSLRNSIYLILIQALKFKYNNWINKSFK